MAGTAGQQNFVFRPDWLKLVILVLLTLGIFFRLFNLERKVYWHDEAETSRQIAGYSRTEFVQQIFNGKEFGLEELQNYQRLHADRGILNTVHSLALDDPQHPPLYYVIARFWVQWFGNSIAVRRSLSALISLLAFPSIYWLCLELFQSSLTGWIAMLLIAASPFLVLYAQEFRSYSLLTVLILLSSASLLRAVRLTNKQSWGIYGLIVGLGLYSHTLFGIVAITHGIYIANTNIRQFRLNSFSFPKPFRDYLVATILGLVIFSPWILIIITRITQAHSDISWLSESISYLTLFKFWILNISFIFFDPNGLVISRVFDGTDDLLTYLIRLPFIVLFIYSLFFVAKNTGTKTYLFILNLIGVTAFYFILPDLVFGGIRSTVPRYLIACYLGIQLSVAYLISVKITSLSFWRQKLWQFITAVLISVGVISCTISSQALAWWNKPASFDNLQVARILNQTNQAIIISDSSDFNPSNTLSLSYLLKSNIRFQLVANPEQLKIFNQSRKLLLLNPSQKLRSYIEKELNYKILSVYKQGDSRELARLEKN